MAEDGAPTTRYDLIFLGTGVSTALPRLSCVLQQMDVKCAVCLQALSDPLDPNCRGNVSVLVRKRTRTATGEEETASLMIDAGKTMRSSALKWFPRHGVSGIDALLLTHGHADACGGLDDLREFTSFIKPSPSVKKAKTKRTFFGFTKQLPVYLNQETFEVCKGAYPYLVPALRQDTCPRRIASVRWEIIDNSEPFEIEGLFRIVPLPVLHGGDYICLGFAFGEGRNIYLSDVSMVQPHIMSQLLEYEIEVLVLDCLDKSKSPSHFCLPDSLELIRKLRPKKTFLVGMSCEFGEHTAENEVLRKMEADEGLWVQCAHDGLRIDLNM